MRRARPFKQVDVFGHAQFLGNPLAVVLDGTGLTDEAMQRFAGWTNLSETTFVLPPTEASADYRVRIFTPTHELDFAGHPTLGTCHAWLSAGNTPHAAQVVVQQCAAGLVKIRRDADRGALALAAPPLRRSSPSPSILAKVAGALGLKAHQVLAAQTLDNGLPWLGLLLQDVDTVLALSPDHRSLRDIGLDVGVAGMRAAAGSASAGLEVRAFPVTSGIEEDPVTGSLNASLAQWLIADDRMPERYVATQGQCLGRDGRIHIERDPAGQVWVGGGCITCIDGTATL